MTGTRALLKNTIILAATSLLINLVSTWFNVYVSNKIGAEAVGVFQLIMSIYMFAMTFSISGIGLASTRLVAEELASGCLFGAKRAVRRCLVYALCFSIPAAFLLASNSDFIASKWLYGKISGRPLYLLAISLPFTSVSSVLSGYFNAMRKAVINASAQILEQLIRILIVSRLLASILPDGLEMACTAIVLASALSEVISFVYRLILYLANKSAPCHIGKRNLTGRMLGIAIPVALSSYIRSALSTIKHLITPVFLEKSSMSGQKALAEYGMIHGMVFPLIMLPAPLFYALSSLLVPEIARLYSSGHRLRINQAISTIFKITLISSICISGLLIMFSAPLGMYVYKNQEIAVHIRLLALLIPIIYLDSITDALLKGLNLQVGVVAINIIDTAATIALICLLLPPLGTTGYILVIYISEILNAYLSIRKLLKATSFNVDIINWILKPILAILLASLITRFFSPFNLIGGMLFTCAVYALMLYAVGSINKSDLRLLS